MLCSSDLILETEVLETEVSVGVACANVRVCVACVSVCANTTFKYECLVSVVGCLGPCMCARACTRTRTPAPSPPSPPRLDAIALCATPCMKPLARTAALRRPQHGSSHTSDKSDWSDSSRPISSLARASTRLIKDRVKKSHMLTQQHVSWQAGCN